MRIGFNNLFSTDVFNYSIKKAKEDFDLAFDLIECAFQDRNKLELDAYAYPFHLLPSEDYGPMKITALVSAGKRTYSLLIHRDLVDTKHRLGFPDNMQVVVPEHFIVNGLSQLSNGMEFSKSSTNKILEETQKGTVNSYILESCFKSDLMDDNYKIIELNEREFGHAPGQGFIAILTNNGSVVQKIIKKLNIGKIIAVSNIERKTSDLLGEPVNIHCELDSAENYLLWAFTSKGSAQITQSTRNRIEERIIGKLLNY